MWRNLMKKLTTELPAAYKQRFRVPVAVPSPVPPVRAAGSICPSPLPTREDKILALTGPLDMDSFPFFAFGEGREEAVQAYITTTTVTDAVKAGTLLPVPDPPTQVPATGSGPSSLPLRDYLPPKISSPSELRLQSPKCSSNLVTKLNMTPAPRIMMRLKLQHWRSGVQHPHGWYMIRSLAIKKMPTPPTPLKYDSELAKELDETIRKEGSRLLAHWQELQHPADLEACRALVRRKWFKYGLPAGVRPSAYVTEALNFRTALPPNLGITAPTVTNEQASQIVIQQLKEHDDFNQLNGVEVEVTVKRTADQNQIKGITISLSAAVYDN